MGTSAKGLTNERRPSRAIGAMVATLVVSCGHHEPPAWDAGTGSLSREPLPEKSGTPEGGSERGTGNESSGDGARGDCGDASFVDPGTLPQTRERPKTATSAFDARARALWNAIVFDEPDRALTAFFPLSAYRQVKAIPAPETDWRRRLLSNFYRDIHVLHEHLGNRAQSAIFTELEVAAERARWIDPNEEGNAIGYWRVCGSKIRYELGARAYSLDVRSLISWRGEWYIVHLSGFK